ncbi:carbonic anhydrase [Cyanobacterium sp. uoEpiScrs1]|uniref:carbonic anhydrase n=1 Tax=Cyanobacterium sp. uoEpiScrs1 TaxID=2976343 RepID=UPI002269B5AD|nr:carbonic anhydrase family protein [Cyanobacterium sp. uoEpiScrs1]
MDRRSFLKSIPVGLAGTTFSLSFPSLLAVIGKENHTEWDYRHPEQWGDISEEYRVCKTGKQQSPIDLQSPIESQLSRIEVSYQEIPLRIINNGHTIQVNSGPGNFISVDNQKFELLQFHFHHPSEHTVNGKNYPMEIHFVHRNEQGSLAVLGVPLKQGQEHQTLQSVWDNMPSRKSTERLISDRYISLDKLLPTSFDSYRYFGSLTTPPCSEIVYWIVFREPLEVSLMQIQQFKQIFPLNARPVQPINRRFILTSI